MLCRREYINLLALRWWLVRTWLVCEINIIIAEIHAGAWWQTSMHFYAQHPKGLRTYRARSDKLRTAPRRFAVELRELIVPTSLCLRNHCLLPSQPAVPGLPVKGQGACGLWLVSWTKTRVTSLCRPCAAILDMKYSQILLEITNWSIRSRKREKWLASFTHSD